MQPGPTVLLLNLGYQQSGAANTSSSASKQDISSFNAEAATTSSTDTNIKNNEPQVAAEINKNNGIVTNRMSLAQDEDEEIEVKEEPSTNDVEALPIVPKIQQVFIRY